MAEYPCLYDPGPDAAHFQSPSLAVLCCTVLCCAGEGKMCILAGGCCHGEDTQDTVGVTTKMSAA